MNIIKAYFSGLIFTIKSYKAITLVYLVTILIALTAAIPFYSVIKSEAAGSMLLSPLLEKFNFTAFNDFLQNHGKVLKPFLSQFFWVSVLYLFFSIFFAGGIVNRLLNEPEGFSPKIFFKGCVEYFFRFLRLAIMVLIFQIAGALIIYIAWGIIISIADFNSEPGYVYSFIAAVVVHIVYYLIILIIGDNAKFILAFDNSRKSLRAFFGAFKVVFRKFLSFFPLYVFILIFPAIITYLYIVASSKIGSSSLGAIFILFILQQIFIWIRIASKFWLLSSQYLYYEPRHVSGIPIEEQKAQELEKIKQEIKVENPLEPEKDE